MNLYDFIESNEIREVRLLQLLLTAGTRGCSYQQSLKELQVTPSTLAVTVASLQQRLQTFNEVAQIRQCNEGKSRRLFLETEKPVLFDDLYREMLLQSKEYRILVLLLEKGKCRIDDLAHQLYMSKAAVFRKIKQLNRVLSPHAIKIKNGTLIGSEVEIRYLYYQLILNSYSSEKLKDLVETFSVRRYISKFEKLTHFKFSRAGETKLCVWLDIALKRHFTGDRKFTDLAEEMLHQLETNPLYQAIRNWLFEIAKQYALDLDEFEVYCIYIFVCSTDVVDLSKTELSQVERYLSFALPMQRQKNQNFLNVLRQIYPTFDSQFSDATQIRIQYTLNQLHHRMQFFQGDLVLLDSPTDSEAMNRRYPQYIEALAKRLVTLAFKDHAWVDSSATQAFLAKNYLRLLMFIQAQMTKPVRIGLLIRGDWLVTADLMSRLQTSLAEICQIVIEIADAPATYDLIITNFEMKSHRIKAKHRYRINEIETTYDIDQIKNLLSDIIREPYAYLNQI